MKKRKFQNVYPTAQGLYSSQFEHDACGVGFTANINGEKSHQVIRDAITILERIEHRGAVGCDPLTGDGAGILMQIPHEFFTKICKKENITLPKAGKYGVAMLFLPQENDARAEIEALIEEKTNKNGLTMLGWRDVPVDPNNMGKLAKESAPFIRQYFTTAKQEFSCQDDFERKLYITRKDIEKNADKTGLSGDDFYYCSYSSRTIVYKGLLLAPQVSTFFLDLNDKDLKSGLAVVHQRFSTNTFPTWPLAQPFRYLAHNGEINTLKGNYNHMRAREGSFASELYGEDIKKVIPVIRPNQSDSACLDNALELFAKSGRDINHAMMMLIPQAWGKKYYMGHDLRGFYEYHAGIMEPWDGPAAVAFSDGRGIGAMLDRNGLRPARYTITKDNKIFMASEAGVIDIEAENIAKRGRIKPGQMLYVDIENNRVIFDTELKSSIARQQPYRRWVSENKIELRGLYNNENTEYKTGKDLLRRQKLFGYSREDVNSIIKPMCDNGMEPTGSMGNDAALAVLSEKPQLLFAYFKQLFAQVTNPAIDPIREQLVMSLMTFIGNNSNILEEKPANAHLLKMKQPILTNEDLNRLKEAKLESFQSATIDLGFEPSNDGSSLQQAIDRICANSENAVKEGKSVIILSDKILKDYEAPVPSLLAVAAVNSHLTTAGLRTSAGIVVETGEAREIMHFALLLGYGATAINPYLAFETVIDLAASNGLKAGIDTVKAIENYIKATGKGIMKIMSKMGISTLRSYRGAQVFEAVGLNNNLIEKYFKGTASRIAGIDLPEIAKEAAMRLKFSQTDKLPVLNEGGQYRYRKNGEKHLWTPDTITKVQTAVRTNNKEVYREYAELINNQEKNLCTLRGLFKFKKVKPVALEEVEPAEKIVKRFVTGAMSLGSLSKEAHETMAIAMNRIGAMSNSGEGGEDPIRFKPRANGDNACSAIKQIASGRFGVTIDYLSHAKELQIKVSQGAKPGEGGQLPGFKVDEFIARVRNAVPGVTLISPPPHHDIYSIEDLAQLIYDLKNANPQARISVKLVSEVGVGTVAAGVSKAHSDMVLISGHDGGTGASPMTSIKHAGLPWELGLAETQQTLVLNKLRDRIRVQVDGQMKTGRDVMIGALLGAEEYGFGTTALVMIGCLMMRQCHSNTCPVGVATQDPALRKRFPGKPEHLINFFFFVAEEVREYLASLGLKSIDEAIGRSDLLEMNEAISFWKTKNLDFSAIFHRPEEYDKLPVKRTVNQDHGIDRAFDQILLKEAESAIKDGKAVKKELPICNLNRTAGAMLSNAVVMNQGLEGLPDHTIDFTFKGTAGQSFGAFLKKGITFRLEGEGNDYVGKGLSGGIIAIKPPITSDIIPEDNVIAGNVLLYGATSGELYINGTVGERFAIRNSGAKTVIEGAGDHCCEYMTGGRVVCLGDIGVNFGAGMSAGIAYILDEKGDFDLKCNLEMIDLEPVIATEDEAELKELIKNHYNYTGSPKAKRILDNWKENLHKFVKVFPTEYRRVLGQMTKEDAEVKREVINN